MKRDSFIFYRSFFEAINELPEENQIQIYTAIGQYSLNFKEPKLQGISKTIWILIKPQLDANNKRFENGSKPKQKQNGSEKKAKDKQGQSKKEANKNDNVNVNDNLNNNTNVNSNEILPISKRKVSFIGYCNTLKNKNPDLEHEIKKFHSYWTESNEKGKGRLDFEKTWDSSRRWSTWKSNIRIDKKTNQKPSAPIERDPRLKQPA